MRDFGAMVAKIRPSLMSRAMRFARSRPGAEDLVQDAMVRALEAWSRWVPDPQLSEEDAFRGWLHRIIANLAIGGMRADERHRRMMGTTSYVYADRYSPDSQDPQVTAPWARYRHSALNEVAERTMAAPPPSPDASVHSEISDETLRLVASIPAKYWDAVAATAKAEEGASSRDVAESTGDTPGNVRKKLYRLRRQLCPIEASDQ